MKRPDLYLMALVAICFACTSSPEKKQAAEETTAQEPALNQLTEAEKADGWKLLFDGETLNGWHKYRSESVGKKWQVVDGTLHFVGDSESDDEAAAAEGGDIVTDAEFENYELNLEWKISPGGNSGIIYNVIESDAYDYVWQTGPEMQVLDSDVHPDGKIITHRAGDLYDLIACSTENEVPVGEWNSIRLIVNQGLVEHWMNGMKVVETEMWTPQWDSLVAQSKFKDMPGFGTGRKGRIALQDHQDKVWYRNIKIKEL